MMRISFRKNDKISGIGKKIIIGQNVTTESTTNNENNSNDSDSIRSRSASVCSNASSGGVDYHNSLQGITPSATSPNDRSQQQQLYLDEQYMSATESIAAALTELHCELRDKFVECEALYETASALSQALQESDRLLELEKIKNEKLMLKISMICRLDAMPDCCDDNDDLRKPNKMAQEAILDDDNLDTGDVGLNANESYLSSELRNRAKTLSSSVISSSSSKPRNRVAALNVQKQLQQLDARDSSLHSPASLCVSTTSKTKISDNSRISVRTSEGTGNTSSSIGNVRPDFGIDEQAVGVTKSRSHANEAEIALSTQVTNPLSSPSSSIVRINSDSDPNEKLSLAQAVQPSSDLHSKSSLNESLEFAETKRNTKFNDYDLDEKAVASTSSNAKHFPRDLPLSTPKRSQDSNASLPNKKDERRTDAFPQHYGSDGSHSKILAIIPGTVSTRVEKPTMTSLPSQAQPSQANFYQIILERDIAQANAKKFSKELKQVKSEIRQLKSRLDLSTALVEISYAGSTDAGSTDTDEHEQEFIEKEQRQQSQGIRSTLSLVSRRSRKSVIRRSGWVRNRYRSAQPVTYRRESTEYIDNATQSAKDFGDTKSTVDTEELVPSCLHLENVVEHPDDASWIDEDDDSVREYMKALTSSSDADKAGGFSTSPSSKAPLTNVNRALL